MSIQKFKLILVIAIVLALSELAKADTKVLSNIRLYENSFREETISLENDKDLVSEGLVIIRFTIPNDLENILKSTINYVADKNGYRAKYTLIKEPGTNRLAIKTLQSLAG